MTLRMLDSIHVADLPAGADAYLAYTDGAWPTYSALKALYPHAHILDMCVFPEDDATGCDCESGDLTVAQVPPWVKRQHARGVKRPVVYASISAMRDVIHALNAAAIGLASVRLLSAHYWKDASGKHVKHICGPITCDYFAAFGQATPQMDGTQWTDTAAGVGGAFIDESLLRDDFFGGTVSATGPEHWDQADFDKLAPWLHKQLFEAGYNSSGWTLGLTLQEMKATTLPGIASTVAALAAKAGTTVDAATLAAALTPVIQQAIAAAGGVDADTIAAHVAALFAGKLGT